jgi:hypothetical protein
MVIRCNGLTRLKVRFVDQSNFLTKIISFKFFKKLISTISGFFFLKDKQHCFDKEKNQIEMKLGLD